MKRTALFSLFILLLTIILPACKEDIYIDWKIINEKALSDTVKKYKDNTDFFTTNSGLSYKVIHQGLFPKKPNSSSIITATYTGKLIDGSKFDSATIVQQVSNLVPGFQEGLKMMNVGGTYRFYMPSSLGYDTISTKSKIPPYSTLIFEVNLISAY